MKIAVIGAGNIGLALANEIYQNTKIKVRLITSRSNEISRILSAVDSMTGKIMHSELDFVTDDYSKGLCDIDVVFITVPSFLIDVVISKVVIKESAIICFVPGVGGKEFYAKTLHLSGNIICGFDRTPFVSRISLSDNYVVYSKKHKVRLAMLKPTNKLNDISLLMSELLKIPCESLLNYLTATLTPSNPLLHTSRLYTMFKYSNLNTKINEQIFFYKEWTDIASDILLKMDSELQLICSVFTEKGINLSGVVSLKDHYEAYSVEGMTNKIKSISSLSNIVSPLISNGDGYYVLDGNSRYFTEDFPFGLCVIKAFSLIADVPTCTIDEVLKWYANLFQKEYYLNNSFCGKDLKFTSIPQNFGINTLESIIDYYS
ncbi:NAD/NADP octopine/nopaline dehydrogenase family protein [Treponema sp. HNW]|uniref:NAD/NADP octopine/nopaline dehydrogenase family protein n=1 Tax=Treponema sp. HNW TaxID=3116654 RepID=UPI003D10138A